MHYLVVVRHGEYNKRTSHLNAAGRAQIRAVTSKISWLAPRPRLKIFCSSAQRTRESATVISRGLGVEVAQRQFLRSMTDLTERQIQQALSLVRRHQYLDMLVLITHLEFTRDLPDYVSREFFGIPFPRQEVAKGGAWLIDFEHRTIVQLAH